MATEWKKKEGNKGELVIEVSAEAVNKALDASFKENVQKVNVPGFRKGKIPRAMYEKRFGVESLYPEAIDKVVNQTYKEALKETGIEPIDFPEVDFNTIFTKFKKDTPFTFTAVVQVRPEPKLGEYKGIEVDKFDKQVTEKDVDEELKGFQLRKAELVLKETGKSEQGDTVVIDFEGFVDDVAFEGGQASNYSLELGSNSFIPGFEDQLIGYETGAKVDVKVTFPADYQAENLAGKDAVFKVAIHEIKQKELPELDDTFAKEIDKDVTTLAELKEKTKKRLIEQKEREEKQYIESTVIEKVVVNAEIDIPEVMIKNETDFMIREFANRLSSQGIQLDMYYQYSGQDEAALREQMKPEAEVRVKTGTVLNAISVNEEIVATEEEINDEVAKIADQVKMTSEEVLKQIGGSTEDIKNEVISRKTIDFLVSNAVIK